MWLKLLSTMLICKSLRLAHTPMEVIQRNFQALGKDDFFSLPSQEVP